MLSPLRFAFALLMVGMGSDASGQVPSTLLYSIFDPSTNAQTMAQQGWSVAIDGNTVVIGAPLDDAGGPNAGSAKVYDATTGARLHTLLNPHPSAGEFFGTAVAISGSRVVVGASWDKGGTNVAGNPVGGAYIYDLAGPTPTLPSITLTNPSPVAGDFFGIAVAISGTRVVIGEPGADTGGTDSGIAYVYDLASASPTVPVVTLSNPSPAANEGFGIAVAISGARVIVAAPWDGTGSPLAGSAYVFDLEGANPTIPVNTLINPSPAANDQFGRAVAIFGTWAVVGADGDDAGANDAGSAYVYDLSSATPSRPAFTLNNPEPNATDNFGGTVTISATRVVVGAVRDDTGATNAGSVYVYDLTTATPTVPVLILNNPSPAAGDNFGNAAAISDRRLVVGTPNQDVGATDAGSAFLYDLAGPTPGVPVAIFSAPSPAFGDFFGRSVAISGSRVVVGADGDDNGATESGSVYVYDLASTNPNVPLIALHNPNPSELDLFGWSVGISGTRVVVGAYGEDNGASNAGVAAIYDLAGGNPGLPVLTLTNPSPAASDSFGAAVAISGAYVVVGALFDDMGATNAGIAYVYNLAGATPTRPFLTLTNPSPAANDLFGSAVAISGTRVVVGAYQDDTVSSDAGSAYVYDLTSPTPAVPTVTLLNPSTFGADSDSFGYSVAISGTRIVVGAYRAGVGRAYVYDLTMATPAVPLLTLNNPTSVDGDYFGRAVSISGTRVVVGAVRSDLSDVDAGSAYLYELTSPTPNVPVATLTNPSPAVGDYFGSAVAIDGDLTVVSAYNDDTNAEDRGATYIFGPPPPSLTITDVTPGFVTLSWSGVSPGFVLQHADSLSPANWLDAPSGAANPVTVAISSAARFYRLFKR